MSSGHVEITLVHIIKIVGMVLIGPLIGLFAYVGRRLHNQVDYLETRVHDLEKHQAVQESQLADIKADISNIDKKLDKIMDRLSQ